MLILLQKSHEEQRLEPDQSEPPEETSTRALTGSSVALEEAQSATTMPGRKEPAAQTQACGFVNNERFVDLTLYNIAGVESRKELLNADQATSSLSAIYLPYTLQHALLVRAQNLLEDCLFKFGSNKMRDVIKDKGWDCAQCVELNDWVKILRKRKDLLNNSSVGTSNRPLSAVLGSLVQLRHTAVHRQRITALKVQLFLEDAESLLGLLGDRESAKEISKVHCSLSDHVKDLSARASLDQEKLRSITREKRMQAFQLQLEEHSAVSRILAGNQDFERDATARFQQRTLCIEITHTRNVSNPTPLRDEECDQHMNQKTFRFCPSCIEDVRTHTRAAVETSSASRDNPTWLSQGASLACAKEIIRRRLTCASRQVLVLILLVSLVSLGALLWPSESGAESITT